MSQTNIKSWYFNQLKNAWRVLTVIAVMTGVTAVIEIIPGLIGAWLMDAVFTQDTEDQDLYHIMVLCASSSHDAIKRYYDLDPHDSFLNGMAPAPSMIYRVIDGFFAHRMSSVTYVEKESRLRAKQHSKDKIELTIVSDYGETYFGKLKGQLMNPESTSLWNNFLYRHDFLAYARPKVALPVIKPPSLEQLEAEIESVESLLELLKEHPVINVLAITQGELLLSQLHEKQTQAKLLLACAQKSN